MALHTLDEVRRRLQKRWDRGLYLADTTPAGGDNAFPLREQVGRVTAQTLHDEYETIRAAAAEYRALETRGTASPTVEWTQRNDRRIGTNSVPAALHFPAIDTLAHFLGTTPPRQLATYRAAAARLLEAFPALHSWITNRPMRLIELTESLEQLIAVSEWIVEHPQPGIYIRQVPVDGIDTKFVERHRGTLTEWWDALLPEQSRHGSARSASFARRYGFQLPPETVRFRILERGKTRAGYTDLRVPIAEFARERPNADHADPVRRVFIVENEVTGLAFPPVSNGIVIFGGGYSIGTLASIRWLSEVPVYYWGDIDTHGFAILNRLRAGHPHTRSILMDRKTLERHRSRWTREPQQATGTLPQLSLEEDRLYNDLKSDRLGEGVRLEQERIDYSYVTTVIADALQN